jgi:hypothetical protein
MNALISNHVLQEKHMIRGVKKYASALHCH